MHDGLFCLVLLIGACAAVLREPPTRSLAQCVIDGVLPWLEANWGNPGEGKPNVMIVSEEVLHQLVEGPTFRTQSLIYGASAFNEIALWDELDLTDWHGQMIVVHELAHWIDFRLDRPVDHKAVQNIARQWALNESDVPCSS